MHPSNTKLRLKSNTGPKKQSWNFASLYNGDCPVCQGPIKQEEDMVTCRRCKFKIGAGKFFGRVKKERVGHWSVKHRHFSEEDKLLGALG